MQWKNIAQETIQGSLITKAEALQLLLSSDDDLLGVLDAAFAIRRHYFGRGITIHVINEREKRPVY